MFALLMLEADQREGRKTPLHVDHAGVNRMLPEKGLGRTANKRVTKLPRWRLENSLPFFRETGGQVAAGFAGYGEDAASGLPALWRNRTDNSDCLGRVRSICVSTSQIDQAALGRQTMD